jgi:CHAD domain-containing protein
MQDQPGFRADAPLPETIRAIAETTLAGAGACLHNTQLTDAVLVHDLRRELKRWRALLRLLAPLLGDEADLLRREARDIARTLGGARDVQAALDAVDLLAKDPGGLSETALDTIRKRIGRLKSSAEAEVLGAEARATLDQWVAQTAARIAHWDLSAATFAQLAAGLADTYRRARRRIPSDWHQATPEELHELRKRVVEYRYQMEFARPLWPKLVRLWVDEAQKLRARLGQHHDLALLAALTRPRQPIARWRSRLWPAIERQQEVLAIRAARIAGRLFADRPNAFRRRLVTLWNARR